LHSFSPPLCLSTSMVSYVLLLVRVSQWILSSLPLSSQPIFLVLFVVVMLVLSRLLCPRPIGALSLRCLPSVSIDYFLSTSFWVSDGKRWKGFVREWRIGRGKVVPTTFDPWREFFESSTLPRL
jgi:hypothetical protein